MIGRLVLKKPIINSIRKREYKVAQPNQWIVKTGPFVKNVDISKKTLLLPFQEHIYINTNPMTIKTMVNAMTIEKIPFNMPMVFTIRPKDDFDALTRYASSFSGCETEKIEEIIIGIIDGNARLLTAGLELESLFNDRDLFNKSVTEVINVSLDKLGLVASNVNIEELLDTSGSEYFKYMRKKALEKAVNRARVDVAEQLKDGDIGEKEHVRVSRKKMAEIEADTQIAENERSKEIYQSSTHLEISKSNFERDKQIAKYEAMALAEMKKIEFQQQVEESRKSLEERTIRAKDMSRATVQAEVLMKDMEGSIMAQKMKAEVEAQIFVIEAKAQFEKQKIDAEAVLFTKQKESDAVLYAEQQKAQAYLVNKESEASGIEKIKAAEAKGIEMVKTAEAVGLAALIKSSDGDIKSLSQYLVATNGTLTDIANAQAAAVQGMKPTVWVTSGGAGAGSEGGGSFSNAMTDIIKNGIPLAHAIKDQTGVDLLATFNVKSDSNFRGKREEKGKGDEVDLM